MALFKELRKFLVRELSLIDEFEQFIMRGIVVDMVVGTVIGAAFVRLMESLMKDIIIPALGWMFGGVSFTELKLVLKPEVEWLTLNYGNFLRVTIDFLLVAFIVFLVIREMNKLHDEKAAKEELAEKEEKRAED